MNRELEAIQREVRTFLSYTGWTQGRLASAAGVSQSTISNLLAGAHSPSFKNVESIRTVIRREYARRRETGLLSLPVVIAGEVIRPGDLVWIDEANVARVIHRSGGPEGSYESTQKAHPATD